MKYLAAFTLSFTLFWSAASFASPEGDAAFDRGVKAYGAGDIKSAIANWDDAVKQGHAMASYLLGQLYEQGKGVAPSHETAFGYFTKAADAGNPQAGVIVGLIYRDGDASLHIKKDYKKAIKMFEIGALQAWPDSQYYLAGMHRQGLGTKQDRSEGTRWLLLAAKKKHVPSMIELGRIQFEGDGVPKDRIKGWSYLDVASRFADAGNLSLVQDAMAKYRNWMRDGEKEQAHTLADQWVAKYIPG